MFSRSGYQALPLGDFDRFQQSSIGIYGAQRGFFSFGDKQDPLGTAGNAADSSQGWLSWICHGIITCLVFLLMVVTFPISGWFALKVVPSYERMIIFRLGRPRAPQGPGLVLLLPFIDHGQRVDLRSRACTMPPCKLTSRDGAVLSVGADVQFRVWDPALAVLGVKELLAATRLMVQSAMARALLRKSLREIQLEKLRIGEQLLLDINNVTKCWGLEVERLELSVEAVLQPPRASPAATVSPVPGREGHSQPLGSSMAPGGGSAPEADSVEGVSEEPPSTALLSRGDPSVDELLPALESVLSEALEGRVGASCQANVSVPGGSCSSVFLDLSSGSGRIGHGVPEGRPDVTLEVLERDLRDLLRSTFGSGGIWVTGDLRPALGLDELLRATGLGT
ncbi:STML1 protein, partial [Menura novaehollandiae]|nr:STML1 protein [Menura novaehollandiae]